MSNNIPYVWFVTTMVISSPEAKYDPHVNFKCSKEIVAYNLFILLNYAISRYKLLVFLNIYIIKKST